MVRRIRNCSRCQRRFTSTGGVSVCSTCLDNDSIQSNVGPPLKPHVTLKETGGTVKSPIVLDSAETTPSPKNKTTEHHASIPDMSQESFDSLQDDCIPLSDLIKNETKGSLKSSGDEQEDKDQKVCVAATAEDTTSSSDEAIMKLSPNQNDNVQEEDCEQQHLSTTEDSSMCFSANDNVCFICGSDLTRISTGLKGRLQHFKRCSKKHGVSARDVKLNDDSELFVDKNVHDVSKSEVINNPYARRDDSWHAGASTDLALAAANDNDRSKTSTTAKPLAKQTTLTNFIQMPVKSLNNVLLAGARRMAKTAQVLSSSSSSKNSSGDGKASGGGRSQKRRRVDYSKLSCPMYKKISGTDFVVDGFLYAKSSLTKNYFLTHFHSDHYGGITKQWNAGIIYCSLETANLVHEQLGVDRKYLHPLGLMTPTIIESKGKPVAVTLLDANHCPGAVMFLFEVGKRRILHVGDFRWNRDLMTNYAPLRPFVSLQYRLDDLLLDTTYCDEKYTLPTQAEAIQATVNIAEQEWQRSKSRGQRTLFLFGAYTIGKERIYLSVAERLGTRVYVDQRRYRILSALNWPRERMALLTTNPDDTCLRVVPLGHINFKNMQPYLGSDKVLSSKKYDRIVGFRPTGWTMSARGNGIVSTQTKGYFTVHGVPYSEHSSFDELVDCLDALKPKRIIPTVSVSKSAEQVELLLRRLKAKQSP